MTIQHVAIWVADLEKMKEFYVRHFGAAAGPRYDNTGTGFSSYFLEMGSGPKLELMRMDAIPADGSDPETQRTGFIHIAVSVGSDKDVDRKTEELRAAGYRILSEPRWTGDGYYESCVFDPENNRIEITI